MKKKEVLFGVLYFKKERKKEAELAASWKVVVFPAQRYGKFRQTAGKMGRKDFAETVERSE